MKKSKKILSAFFILLGIICLSSTIQVAEAYVKEGWKLPSKSVTFKWDRTITIPGSVIRNGWEKAISSWKTASGFNFNAVSSSVNSLGSWYEYSSTYYGVTHIYRNTSTGLITKFEGLVNAGNTNISKSNVAQSTGVHELGHVIGIAHNNGVSIMNSNRDRTRIYTPQTDDKNGVNAIY